MFYCNGKLVPACLYFAKHVVEGLDSHVLVYQHLSIEFRVIYANSIYQPYIV